MHAIDEVEDLSAIVQTPKRIDPKASLREEKRQKSLRRIQDKAATDFAVESYSGSHFIFDPKPQTTREEGGSGTLVSCWVLVTDEEIQAKLESQSRENRTLRSV